MGLLRNLKETDGRGGAIVFWAIVGGAGGFGLANVASLPAGATTVATCIGFGFGIGPGFYAAFGTSDLARALALPGAVLELLQ